MTASVLVEVADRPANSAGSICVAYLRRRMRSPARISTRTKGHSVATQIASKGPT